MSLPSCFKCVDDACSVKLFLKALTVVFHEFTWTKAMTDMLISVKKRDQEKIRIQDPRSFLQKSSSANYCNASEEFRLDYFNINSFCVSSIGESSTSLPGGNQIDGLPPVSSYCSTTHVQMLPKNSLEHAHVINTFFGQVRAKRGFRDIALSSPA